jgi:hypothetical protein
MSGKKIDENNPPMLLPNGRVYSLQVKLQNDRSHDLLARVRLMTKTKKITLISVGFGGDGKQE